jgi:RNA polymerase sigma-70 factor (ECF subfamily)
MAGLLEILSADVVAYSDGGGKTSSAINPIFGADRVARFTLGVTRKDPPASIELVDVNGSPGVLLKRRNSGVHSVLFLEVVDGRVETVYAVRNPDKLLHIP